MRVIGIALLAASLFATGARAEPLSPGKPAGVRQARLGTTGTAIMLGTGAVVLAGVGILVSGQSSVLPPLKIDSQGIIVPPPVVVVSSTTTTGTN